MTLLILQCFAPTLISAAVPVKAVRMCARVRAIRAMRRCWPENLV